jgi:hypothetical protein
MRAWAKNTARSAVLTAAFVGLGASAAVAGVTNGNGSVGGGNQVNAPITVPVNACGNAIAVLGVAGAGCEGGAPAVGGSHSGPGGGQYTSGSHSILGGNQVNAPVTAPVNVCGNGANATAHCRGGAYAQTPGGGTKQITNGEHSILGGNQVNAPVAVPVNVCGNAIAVLGDASAACAGGASTGHNAGTTVQITSGKHSILGGNQVNAPVNVPVNVCGNAVALLGHAYAGCRGGAETGGGAMGGGSGYCSMPMDRSASLPDAAGTLTGLLPKLPTLPTSAPAINPLRAPGQRSAKAPVPASNGSSPTGLPISLPNTGPASLPGLPSIPLAGL